MSTVHVDLEQHDAAAPVDLFQVVVVDLVAVGMELVALPPAAG